MTDVAPGVLASDPEWVPHTYDAAGGQLTFVHVPREARETLMFLSDDHYKGDYRNATCPVPRIAAEIGSAREAPLHFIFHTAFCCSTLLIKALDVPGRSVGLKEPDVLIHLANRISNADDAANRQRLALVLRLLSRPFAEGEKVIVKPSNFANRLIEPALSLYPQARAVLLYSELATMLHSIAKRAVPGRIWARQLYRSQRNWTRLDFGYGPAETFDQTDLQIAGLAWLMQIHHFGEVARRLGPQRVMLLDSASFLERKADSLKKAADLFGIGLAREEVEEIAAGPVFSRHAKFSQLDYDDKKRDEDNAAIADAYGGEIEMVEKWIEAVAAHLGVKLPAAALGAGVRP